MPAPDTRLWLPNPPKGTQCAGGFDGSENDDHTAIKLETRSGRLFTPRYGPDQRPTIWNPAEWGGTIPRDEVNEAWAELTDRYELARVYCDPGFHDETSWETEIEDWAGLYGEEVFLPWPTNQIGRMYPACTRFVADLKPRKRGDEILPPVLTHDGCPLTTTHVGNARKFAKSGDRYILGKPSQTQKIDAGVTSVICHEAACDVRAEGWPEPTDNRMLMFR